MRRREFITLLGGAVFAWPACGARAAGDIGRPPWRSPLQQPASDRQIDTIQRGLRDLGHIEGRKFAIEYRYAQGKPERLPELAAELVRLRLNVILAIGGDVAEFAKMATQSIPLVGAFRRARDVRADAIYVVSSRHTVLNLPLIIEFATKDRVPLAGGWGDWAKAGELLSYGPNVGINGPRAATLLDKTLKGTNPADLPVHQPTKFELIINLRSAKALNLDVPPMLLARADEVIE